MSVFADQGVIAGTTPRYTATLRNQAGTPLGPSSLTTLTLTLRDGYTAEVINGVSATNILNTGRGTLGADGALAIVFTAADTAARSTRRLEWVRAIIEWIETGGWKDAAVVHFSIENPAGTT